MKELKLDRNRKRVKYCPCGRSNRDGKFVPFIGYDKYGYCHSCTKTIRPDDGTIINPIPYKQPPIFYYDPILVSESGRDFKNNNLVTFLLKKFTKTKVKGAISKYLIGTTSYWLGATIFWQIDHEERVCYGKIMLYNSITGKRSKEHFNTVQKALKIDARGFKTKQCLFGLHLINETNTKRLAVVESEKTAIVMSMIFSEFVWLATGGKGNFKYDILEPIKSYKIVAFPDKDAIAEWNRTAIKLKKYGFNIEVDTMLKDMDVDDNTDLADIFLNPDKESTNKTQVQQLVSKQDLNVGRLIEHNPILKDLISEFDLVHENGKEIRIEK